MDSHLDAALERAIANAYATSRRPNKTPAIAAAHRQWLLLQDIRRHIESLEQRLAATEQAEPPPQGADHPFAAYTYPSDHGPVQTYHLAAEDRLRAVRTLDARQCEAALRLPGLQVTVRKALERRLRHLQREAHG